VTVADAGQSLAEWLAPVHITCVVYSEDSVLLGNLGFELRWYLEKRAGSYEVSTAERAGDTQLLMRTSSLDDAERFIVSVLGLSLRSRVMPQSPFLVVPSEREDLASGFELVERPEGPLYAAVMQGDVLRAEFSSRTDPFNAVVFSTVADAPVADIKKAFLDELGEPLFQVDLSRRQRQ
jgi:hypothetical protein